MSAGARVPESDVQRLAEHSSMRALLASLEQQLTASPVLARENEGTGLGREAREMVAALLNVAPGEVSRRSGEPVSPDIALRAHDAARRRALGEPVAYCVGSAAFRHLDLKVDRRVLIPRPETETVVEQALALVRHAPGGVAVDIGTGSGAIALSLATEGRFDAVIATDVSSDALAVAGENLLSLRVPHCPVEFRLGADFAPLGGIKARVIVSNPPYIALDEAVLLPASVREWEPSVALFAEQGGMARYDALLAGAPRYLEPGGWIVLEVDARRAQETARRAASSAQYSSIQLLHDLAGRERVLVAQTGADTH